MKIDDTYFYIKSGLDATPTPTPITELMISYEASERFWHELSLISSDEKLTINQLADECGHIVERNNLIGSP